MKNLSKLMIAGAVFTSLTAVQAGVKPERAEELRDSLGICLRLHFPDSPYYKNFSKVKQRLGEMNVKYARERLQFDAWNSETVRDRMIDLHNSFGIKFNNRVDERYGSGSGIELDNYKVDDALAYFKAGGTGYIDTIEGPNEYNSTYHYDGNQDWVSDLRSFYWKLQDEMNKDSFFSGIPLVGPSIWESIPEDVAAVGRMDGWIDYNNLHAYPNGRPPTVDMNDWLNDANSIDPYAPIYVTEFGYTTCTDQIGVSEKAAAKYMPRMWVEYFMEDTAKMFIHELVDMGTSTSSVGSNWGLCEYDFSPKKQFNAFKSILSTIKDTASNSMSFGTDTIEMSFSYKNSDTHTLLLQKADEEFYLLLWREVRSWDNTNHNDISNGSDNMQVIFDTPIVEAEQFKFDDNFNYVSSSPNVWGNDKRMTLYVPDDIMIVRFKLQGI